MGARPARDALYTGVRGIARKARSRGALLRRPAQQFPDRGETGVGALHLAFGVGGRVGAVIGDVQGHDTHAAAVMGQLRTAVRAYARLDLPPHEIMAEPDDDEAPSEEGAEDDATQIWEHVKSLRKRVAGFN